MKPLELAQDKTARALQAYAFAQTAYLVASKLYTQAREKIGYTISVDSKDALFPVLNRWILENVDNRAHRSLQAQTIKSGSPYAVSGYEESDQGLKLFGSVGSKFAFHLGASKVYAYFEREIAKKDGDTHLSENLVLTTRTITGRDAVVSLLETLAVKANERPKLYVASPWGEFRRGGELRFRSMDTVYLESGLKEEIVKDISGFLSSEDRYRNLGIPWHRGYVFHGPPGTGKTTLPIALANQFNLDVYVVALSDLNGDTKLGNLVADIRDASILLLEDIDVVHAAKERDDDNGEGITASGLLNALDGIATPQGLITVITTNKLEVLEDALLRPGRADVIREFGYLDQAQLNSMICSIFPHWGGKIWLKRDDVTPADIVGAITANIYDDSAALEAIRSKVEDA